MAPKKWRLSHPEAVLLVPESDRHVFPALVTTQLSTVTCWLELTSIATSRLVVIVMSLKLWWSAPFRVMTLGIRLTTTSVAALTTLF